MIAGARRGHRVSAIATAGYWSRRENRPLYVERLTGLSLFTGAVCAVLLSGGNALALAATKDRPDQVPLLPWAAALVMALPVAALVGLPLVRPLPR